MVHRFQKFGEAVKAGRVAKDLTQEALAEKLGVTQPTVSAWERGVALPVTSTIVDVADELDLDLGDLVRRVAITGGEHLDPAPVG